MNTTQIIGSLMLHGGMRVPELARQLGVSRQAVHATIKGKNASSRIRLAIAQVIGKQVVEIWPDPKTYTNDKSILPENNDVGQALRKQRPELPPHDKE